MAEIDMSLQIGRMQELENELGIVASYMDVARRQYEMTSRPGRDTSFMYRHSLGAEWIQLKAESDGFLRIR
jgi:hypothetical protein